MSVATKVASYAMVVQPELAQASFNDTAYRFVLDDVMCKRALWVTARADLDKDRTHNTLPVLQVFRLMGESTRFPILALPKGVEYAENSLTHQFQCKSRKFRVSAKFMLTCSRFTTLCKSKALWQCPFSQEDSYEED